MYGAIWVEDDGSEEEWSIICGSPEIQAPEVPNNHQPTTVPASQISSTTSRVLGFSAGLLLFSAILL